MADLLSNSQKKFPSIKIIKQVYQAIADYLQIPVGSGEGIYYNFDLAGFIKYFKLDALLVVNVLKVLEQEDHISFSENIFLPSQVSFTVDKDLLNLFEKENADLEPIIKALLRSYEGIINNRVSVYEQQIAKICRLKIEEINLALKQLMLHGIIEYLPKKETPQIQYLVNRAPAEYLIINQDAYLERKKLYEERVQTITHYTSTLSECRSRYISNYFGDESKKNCGICDNCLNEKKKKLTNKEFGLIEEKLKALGDTVIALNPFIDSFKLLNKEKVWAALTFLQSEEKIIITETKEIKWVNN